MKKCPTPWLGTPHGYFTDWVTQRWVQLTGRYVSDDEYEWLEGPIGNLHAIGDKFFDELAHREELTLHKDLPGSGLIQDFEKLRGPQFDPTAVHRDVIDFYQHTSQYDLDAWGRWCGLFLPFGKLLAFFFSRRLQQLNVPLSSLDTSRGITSEIVHLIDPSSGEIKICAWVRKIISTDNVLYAGSYSLCKIPGYDGVCIKVVFPLPNGNAVVIMKPEVHEDGSMSVTSAGEAFGDPGFYFVVRNPSGSISAKYLRTLRESIHVYAAEKGKVRADHTLKLWGLTFLMLHYGLTNQVNQTYL